VKRSLILIISMFALSACGKSAADEYISKTKSFKDKMCACSDKDCAEKVGKEHEEWEKDFVKNAKESKADKPSEEQQKEFKEARKEMRECARKHKDGGKKDGEKKEEKKE
jgi:hypothetical protein